MPFERQTTYQGVGTTIPHQGAAISPTLQQIIK